ncbi:MAG TPA: hypothetical protein GX704_00500 [Clostridiales bacterium]|jgi:predicted translin family RNA/ssDNA-binding protein|nr:hypothetical protein [Clostridiales bacterium]
MDTQDKISKIRRLISRLEAAGTFNREITELCSAVADMLEALEAELDELRTELETNTDLIDELDSDLSDLEDVIYGEDPETEFVENDWADIEFEVVCPQCGEKSKITLDVDPEAVICPKCGCEYDCIDQLEAIEDNYEEEPEL